MADLYLIDGSNLLYRSFYALPALSTSTGQPTGALYGVAVSVFKLLQERKPSRMAVAFDVKGPTIRHQLFARYKMQRPPAPEDLIQQAEPVKEFFRTLGVAVVEQEGCEADDLIAGIALKSASAGDRVFILTGDKDLFQLLGERICILSPGDGSVRDAVWFRATYGFEPALIPDYLALMGDASDNIPGVRGIGEKTAGNLIRRFGTLENLYAHIHEVTPPRIRRLLVEGKEDAFASRELVVLRPTVPAGTTSSSFSVQPPDHAQVRSFLERFELRRLVTAAEKLFPSIGKDEQALEEMMSVGDNTEVPFAALRAHPDEWRRVLEDANIPKAGFNLKEKAAALWRKGVLMRNFAFDGAIARYLTGTPVRATTLAEAFQQYRTDLARQNLTRLFFEVEMPLAEVLFGMERAGIGIDRAFLDSLREEFSRQMKEIEERIYQAAGAVFNINSSRQLASVLFERLGLQATKKTRSGYSTDSSVLEELRHLHPLPALVLEYRGLFKLYSTYVEALIPFISAETGRIHPTFNQTATATGRLSCSNPNLQNLPIRTEQGGLVRKAFRPSPGNYFYSFDYSQVELRILAHLSGDEELTKVFEENRDIHQETADRLFGSGSLFSMAPQDRDPRRVAKTINFGIIYGMSAFGLSKELGIPVEQARAFIDAYFRTFPGVKEYIARALKEAEHNGYVSTLLGRRRAVPELASADRTQKEFGKRVAINMPIQGLAADMIKIAMVRISREIDARGARSLLVLQIHDELLFDAPPEEEGWLVPCVRDAMCSAIPLRVPVRVDVRRGADYLELEPVA